ncbi:MAG: ribbon-helix-helix domain-containing protein [Candidatus Hodarchaeota archaeon]
MKLISFKAPNTYLEGLDDLVREGVYSSRSEAIRIAIRDLLKRELDWGTGGSPASLVEVD